jgi:hypothetical protein
MLLTVTRLSDKLVSLTIVSTCTLYRQVVPYQDYGFCVHDYAGLSQVYLEDKPGNVSHNNMFRDVCFDMLPNDQKI